MIASRRSNRSSSSARLAPASPRGAVGVQGRRKAPDNRREAIPPWSEAMTEENEVSLELVGSQPPAEQMHDLDFLLGSISCVVNTGTKMKGEIHPVLGGHYLEWRLTVDRENGQHVNGVFVIGWNAADKVFSSYYYDDAYMQGSSTSTGWHDGIMTFEGQYTLGETRVEIRTMFE